MEITGAQPIGPIPDPGDPRGRAPGGPSLEARGESIGSSSGAEPSVPDLVRTVERVAGPSLEDRAGDDGATVSPEDLSESEKREVAELERRDREVRAHEAAHLQAAGAVARGGAEFQYQVGPDGKRYAVGGEVSIDVSPVPGDPQATVAKAQQIRRAATAPAQPSGADRAIAAQASRMEAEARQEMARDGDSRALLERGAPLPGRGGAEGAIAEETTSGASESPEEAGPPGTLFDTFA